MKKRELAGSVLVYLCDISIPGLSGQIKYIGLICLAVWECYIDTEHVDRQSQQRRGGGLEIAALLSEWGEVELTVHLQSLTQLLR